MSKFNNLIDQIEKFEILATGNRSSYFQKLAQTSDPSFKNILPINMAPLQKMKFPPIPKDVQRALVTLGLLGPTGVDGILGPETRKAINQFRDRYNVLTNLNDNDVFNLIRDQEKRDIA